jgi:hypothetical protein
VATAKEIEKELAVALKEIGTIRPTFDKETNSWVFSHKLYPVECDGSTQEDVVERYPLYLKEFIKHRLEDRLDKRIEARTHGRGGFRPGAGRPRGSTLEPKTRVYVPFPFAEWVREPDNLKWISSESNIRKLDGLVRGIA